MRDFQTIIENADTDACSLVAIPGRYDIEIDPTDGSILSRIVQMPLIAWIG